MKSSTLARSNRSCRPMRMDSISRFFVIRQRVVREIFSRSITSRVVISLSLLEVILRLFYPSPPLCQRFEKKIDIMRINET